ncbi:MAG: hypothetical protein U1D99_06705, partial [Candidatus Omnitrophota bacterium]|nr:hypothetical protein [Candidatus Omnitrophota bacterium]
RMATSTGALTTNSITPVEKVSKAYDRKALGVVSTDPAFIMGWSKNVTDINVSLAGRVPVKVTAENGPIRTGDLLVAASTPGHAMKYNPDGNNLVPPPEGSNLVSVVGVALEDFDGAEGTILVFVNLEHQRLTVATSNDLATIITIEEPESQSTLPNIRFNANAIFAAKLAAESGNWALDDEGKLVIKEIETEKIKITSDNLPAGRQGTVGFGRIRLNSDTVDIANTNVTDKSLIFVTFVNDLAGKSYYVSQKVASVYFTVKLSSPAITDLDFQYWIVESDLDYQAFVDEQSGNPPAPAPAPVEEPLVAPEPEQPLAEPEPTPNPPAPAPAPVEEPAPAPAPQPEPITEPLAEPVAEPELAPEPVPEETVVEPPIETVSEPVVEATIPEDTTAPTPIILSE